MTPPQITPVEDNTTDDSSASLCARSAARHVPRAVRCNLGPVVDLSTTGMRIISARVPRSPVDVELFAMNKSINVRGRVAWSNVTGTAFQNEVGIVFSKLSRAQREVLESLARGRIHNAIL